MVPGVVFDAPPPGMEPTIRVPTRIVATALAAPPPNPPPGVLGVGVPRPRHPSTPRRIQLTALVAPYAATSAATPSSIFGRCVTRAIVAGRHSVISGPPRSLWLMSCATSSAAAGVSACRLHAGSRPAHNSSRDRLIAGSTCAPRAWPFCPTRPARAPSVSCVPKGVPLSAAISPPTDATSRLATSIGLVPGSIWPICFVSASRSSEKIFRSAAYAVIVGSAFMKPVMICCDESRKSSQLRLP